MKAVSVMAEDQASENNANSIVHNVTYEKSISDTTINNEVNESKTLQDVLNLSAPIDPDHY